MTTFSRALCALSSSSFFRPGDERGALQIGENFPRQLFRPATMSASPASIALRGMESNLAVAGSCTSTTPAFSLMARRPIVPSEPMPERITPTLCSC
jgi:hypothetical protein